MSASFNATKACAEVFLSHLTEFENTWKPSSELDSRDKSEEYNTSMEKISKEVNTARDRFETEYRLLMVWQSERQTEAAEKIANTLEAILDHLKDGLVKVL